MAQTHIHLLITRLPIFGALLEALVLAFGLWKNSPATITAGYGVLVLAALGAGVAYLTGEGAAETVEHLPGVRESRIGQHEDFALYALVSLLALGAVALAGLVLSTRQAAVSNVVAKLTLLLALVGFGLAGWTGYLGGQIRHTELNGAAGPGGGQKTAGDND